VLDVETAERALWTALRLDDSGGFVAGGHVCVIPEGKAHAYDCFSVLSDL